MKKNTLLLFQFLFLYVLLIGQNNRDAYLYSDYLENKTKSVQIYKHLKNNEYSNALELSKRLTCKDLACRDKYYFIGLCYFGLGNNTKSRRYILRALKSGFEPDDVKCNYISVELPVSDTEINQARKNYISRIDVKQRSKFSLNEYSKTWNNATFREMLRSTIEKQGWPGINTLGHQTFCKIDLPPKAIFTSLQGLSTDSLKYYFPIIYAECEKYNEDWSELENLASNELKIECDRNNYVHLHYIFLDKNNNIDIEKSMLLFNILAETFKKEYWNKITLCTSSDITESNSTNLLNQIKRKLIVFGIEEYKIEISRKQQTNVKGLFFMTVTK